MESTNFKARRQKLLSMIGPSVAIVRAGTLKIEVTTPISLLGKTATLNISQAFLNPMRS